MHAQHGGSCLQHSGSTTGCKVLPMGVYINLKKSNCPSSVEKQEKTKELFYFISMSRKTEGFCLRNESNSPWFCQMYDRLLWIIEEVNPLVKLPGALQRPLSNGETYLAGHVQHIMEYSCSSVVNSKEPCVKIEIDLGVMSMN